MPPVRTLREAQGKSLFQLAKEADVDPGHLSRIERGLICPSVAVTARLARALGLKDLARLLRPWDTHRRYIARDPAGGPGRAGDDPAIVARDVSAGA